MDKLLENLNKAQTEAAKHRTGPLLIVAGAGTGKTTVITRKIAYLIEQKLATPEEILALTFTEKAASEMNERVDLLLPLGFHDLWISTFHSFCERILKNHALDIGIPNDFTLLNGVKQWILVYKNFEKFNLNYYRPLGSPNKFIDALLSHFSRCKDEIITPEEYLKYTENLRLNNDQPTRTKRKEKEDNTEEGEINRLEEVANAYHTYQKLLLDGNFLDFGDLINYTLELFKKRQEILKYYQQKFKYILVDEFQDTNFAQYQLVKLLSGDTKNLVVVGDDDQSIYKFRGASVSNILKFKKDYPGLKQITLTENYRSGQKILDLAYNFIQLNNPERLEIKLNIDKKLKSNQKNKSEIKVLEGYDLSGELNAVVKKALELKKGSVSWNDFAILIRANSAAEALLPILASGNIPYTFVANKGLFKKEIIVDILSYIKLLDNLYDSQSLYRVLTLPKFHLEHLELSSLLFISNKKAISLFDCLKFAQTMPEISQESRAKLKNLKESLEKHSKNAKEKTAAEMLVQIIKDIGIEQKLKEDTLENAQSRELLDQFYKKTEEFEKENSDKHIHNFLNQLNLEMEAGNEGDIKFDPNLGPESLKILTVHSAKGLEFKYVFLVNLVDQRFPTRRKKESIEIPEKLIKDILPEGDFHLQEERRLFYVAMTRAKQGLFFSWAKDYGGSRTKKPSQFLIETGLVPSEKISLATGRVVFEKKPKRKIIYKNLPARFSYSQINDFKSCPLKYKYQHYLKLPVKGSHYFSFGQTIHKVLEEFLRLYQNNSKLKQTDLFGEKKSESPLPEFELLESLYRKYWIEDWYKNKTQKEEYKKEGLKILKTFYENLKEKKVKPKFIEKFFKLKIGNYDFVGKIDRGDETKEGLEIIDYKTGKVPKTKKNIDQLYIYQWATEEAFKEKVAKLKYWYLQENKFIEEEVCSKTEIAKLKKELQETINEIIETIKYDLFKEKHAKLKNHKCEFETLE